eukprot:2746764-Amphidinium_carterae.1
MSHGLLLANIENGLPVEGGDRILQQEYQRVEVLAGLAGVEQRGSASMATGTAISVHGSVDETERHENPDQWIPERQEAYSARPLPEENLHQWHGEVEAKARRTEERYYSYNIEQHVVMLQAVVQQFEILYSVAQFAGQGLEEQGIHHHVLKQAVEYLDSE